MGLGGNRRNPCRFSEAQPQRELPLDVRQKAELDIHIPQVTCEGIYDKITELFFFGPTKEYEHVSIKNPFSRSHYQHAGGRLYRETSEQEPG